MNDVTENLALQKLDRVKAGVDVLVSDEEKECDYDDLYLTVVARLHSPAVARATLGHGGHLRNEIRKTFNGCQRALGLEKLWNKK